MQFDRKILPSRLVGDPAALVEGTEQGLKRAGYFVQALKVKIVFALWSWKAAFYYRPAAVIGFRNGTRPPKPKYFGVPQKKTALHLIPCHSQVKELVWS
jgi:hypothetical protein